MISQFNISKGNNPQTVAEYADYCEKVLREIHQELEIDDQKNTKSRLILAEKSMIYTTELESLFFQCYGEFISHNFKTPSFFDLVTCSIDSSFQDFCDEVELFITNQVNFTNTLRQHALKS